MSEIIKEQVLQQLSSITVLGKKLNLVELEVVSSIIYKNENLGFAINIDSLQDLDLEQLKEQCVAKLKKIVGIKNVTIVFTGQKRPKQIINNATPKQISGVKSIIAIASCKGGVGKSTVASNLAVACASLGYKVGLVDADIYGPSIPKMMGVKEYPIIENNKMLPITSCGVKILSMGFLLPDNVATIWRGPMATKALYQLFRGANWGELDVLFVDMPPGTGDIYLSLVENYDLTGVVIVTTPQAIAVVDVQKSINMLLKLGVNILGLIENMSYFIDPNSGNKSYIFGEGGANALAEEHSLKLLGNLPLDMEIRKAADFGRSLIITKSENDSVRLYQNIASKLMSAIEN